MFNVRVHCLGEVERKTEHASIAWQRSNSESRTQNLLPLALLFELFFGLYAHWASADCEVWDAGDRFLWSAIRDSDWRSYGFTEICRLMGTPLQYVIEWFYPWLFYFDNHQHISIHEQLFNVMGKKKSHGLVSLMHIHLFLVLTN